MTDTVISVHAFIGELWIPVEKVAAPSLKLAQDTAILRSMERAQKAPAGSKPLCYALTTEAVLTLGESTTIVAYLDGGGVPLEVCPPSVPVFRAVATSGDE